jgi:hypothetical protein
MPSAVFVLGKGRLRREDHGLQKGMENADRPGMPPPFPDSSVWLEEEIDELARNPQEAGRPKLVGQDAWTGGTHRSDDKCGWRDSTSLLIRCRTGGRVPVPLIDPFMSTVSSISRPSDSCQWRALASSVQ